MKSKAVSGIMLTLLLISLLTLASTIQSVRAEPTTWTVDDDGPADFHSIQDAINHANEGDTIYVYNGTYYEHLRVDKSLMLVGEDPATTIIDGSGSGRIIAIADTNGISINGFTIQNGYRGIDLYTSSDNTICNNTLSSNSNIGLYISWYSNRNNVTGNTVTSSGYIGVDIMYSSDNVLRSNNISNNNSNFMVLGLYTNDIDTSNSVNGKPIYYLTGQNNLLIDPFTFPNIGYLGVISSKNITIKDLNLTRNGSGVLFANVADSIIEHVNATNNIYGIILESSSNNSIIRNTIVDNRFNGIGLWSSNDNAFIANDISRNSVGIRLHDAEGNMLTCNTISHSHGKYTTSATGIAVYFSRNNRIFHNNFINNSLQAYIRESSANLWDDGYPSGGNYWSDYTGVDLYSGPDQNETGSDGIGDTCYSIPIVDVYGNTIGFNYDSYPLVNPWAPISWEYVFEDERKDTMLKISIDDKHFQFIAPGKEFSVKHDLDMAVTDHFIFIYFEDSEITLLSFAIITPRWSFCVAMALDVETGERYLLIDVTPPLILKLLMQRALLQTSYSRCLTLILGYQKVKKLTISLDFERYLHGIGVQAGRRPHRDTTKPASKIALSILSPASRPAPKLQ